jgi:hypothetical protein
MLVRLLVRRLVRLLASQFPYHFFLLFAFCFKKNTEGREKSTEVENWLRQNCFAPGNGCPFLFFSYYRLSKCYFFLNMVCLNMGSLFSRLVGFMKYGKGGVTKIFTCADLKKHCKILF